MCLGTKKEKGGPDTRQYGGPGHFEAMAKAAHNDEDKAIIAGAILSFVYFMRVAEVAALRPLDI